MPLFEIHNRTGDLLASGGDLSDIVRQLVEKIDGLNAKIKDQQAEIDRWTQAEPDISATAPEHVAVFSAGWRSCQRATWDID